MVIVNKLIVQVNNKTLLHNISCSLLPGRITLFIGKSGAGKTTLLQSLVGLLVPSEGEILVDTQPLQTMSTQQRAEYIGFVFQEFNLFAHMTVLQNCIDPLMVHGMSNKQAQERARNILQKLGMIEFVKKYPAQLSGGQQQRVAIARALCLNPKALLLDEPTASLDPHNTDILVNILRTLAAQGLTIALSSQDMSFVQKLFDRMYYIEAGSIVEFCDGKAMLEQCPAIQRFVYSFS